MLNFNYISLASGGSKGGREGRTPPPSASKFFQFHAVFGRIWQNCVFTPPPWRVHAPPLGEILDPSLLADPGVLPVRTLCGPNFSKFYEVFRKKFKLNRMLPPEGWAPVHGESWIRRYICTWKSHPKLPVLGLVN